MINKSSSNFTYENHPELNGSFCILPDGINIYDHLDKNGNVDFNSIKKEREKRFFNKIGFGWFERWLCKL